MPSGPNGEAGGWGVRRPVANGIPGWVDAAAKLTTTVGVPTVFAAVLLYFVLVNVHDTLQVIENNEEARTRLLAETQAAFIAAIDRSAERFEIAINGNIKANEKMAEIAHQERVRLLEKLGKE